MPKVLLFYRLLVFLIVALPGGLFAQQGAVVVDVHGNKVRIADASRIIPLGGPLTEIVFALGAGAQVVARDSSSTYPASVMSLPVVGYQRRLSAEGVLALRPTLILATTEAGPPEAMQQLADSGVTTLVLEAEDTVSGTYAKIRGFARALGKTTAAESLIRQIKAELRQAQAITRRQRQKPRVMFLYARGAGHINASGNGTGAHAMIELAGGQNAISGYSGYKPLTAEAAVAAAPELILLFKSGLQSIGGTSGLLKLPGISQTPAGQSQKIVAMDGLLLLNFGPRLGQAVKTLTQAIHQ